MTNVIANVAKSIFSAITIIAATLNIINWLGPVMEKKQF